MAVGYLQWFHLLPALLRRASTQATSNTLNLSPAASVAPRSPLGLNTTRPLGLSEAARPPVPQFNDRGQTPLERVFRDED
jgi:hypothetical protein